MDSITIYEFLKEKSTIPTGPGSYSNSKEISNSLKTFKKNNNLKVKKKKDINFYDYDGTLVDSYSTEEFLQLSTMPANPSHDGLTAQGWNYTLPDAKEYASEYGKLNIGQMYITNDGKTRLHINLEDGRLKPCLGLGINGSVIVDWGDNSQTDTMTGSSLSTAVYQEHEYSVPGEYTISITATGEIAFLGDSNGSSQLLTKADGDANTNTVYLNSIRSIEVGSNILSIDNSAFQNCHSLTSITIPNNVTSIGNSAFNYCCSLTSITIPSNVTSIGNSAFQACYSLTSITIPNNVTSIGNSAFSYCCSLTSITIPSNVTSIGDSAFNYCYSLTSITIPNNVTSIGDYAFSYCRSLTSITIPNNVTSIGGYAFRNCFGLGFIKFESSTPAEILSINVWDSVPNDCIIYIPQGSLTAYTSASNYPNSSTYTYIEY